ncbi:MAG: 50S ribosomal protein L3 [Verrucomicrobiota bacterium]
MSVGILGKKVGMTRVYDDKGAATPVTVIEAAPNVICQVKSTDKDGYQSYQVGYDDVADKRVSKPRLGHFKKKGLTPKRKLKEITFNGEELKVGDEIKVSRFEAGQLVDVIGTGKGRGFQGVVKRHKFHGSCDSHGSMMHRRPGAIGAGSTPGRVFKNQPMPGHMGSSKVTVQNLRVVQVREDDNVLLIKGAVPGPNGGYVMVRSAVKGQKNVATNGAEKKK